MLGAGGNALQMKPPAGAAEGFLLEAFLPYELSVAANRISRLFARRYSAEFGLSIAQWRVLAVVGRFGHIAPGAVAERAEMDKVKVSRAAALGDAEPGPAPTPPAPTAPAPTLPE